MASRAVPPVRRPRIPTGAGVENDPEIAAALAWLAF